MIKLVNVISSEFDKQKSRIVKYLRLGKSDIQTSEEVSPYGVDSSPIKNMIAVYCETSVKGENVIIGYINKNQLAAPGEVRNYSTDANGNLKFYTWLKNDGTYLLGGDVDNAVRYSALALAFNQLRTELNAHIALYNAHVHVILAAGAVPAPFTTSPTATPATPSTADISPAKIEEIKTL